MKKLSARKKKWIERTVANNRSYKVLLYNRFFMFLLAVLLQIIGYGVIIYLAVYDSPIGILLQALTFALEIVTVLHILNRYERPSLRLNWIIIILIAPVFGVPMYLFNGRGRPTRKMKNKIENARKENERGLIEVYGEKELPVPATRGEAVSRYLAVTSGYPVFYSGAVSYYADGAAAFEAMKAEIARAKRFIFVEYFIIAHGKMWNETLRLLLEKAEQGVQVRILYDDFGCMMTLPPRYDEYLESLHENVKCMTFNNVVPFFAVRMNNRDHRKLLVIDGETAFTGGLNLADEYIGEKRRFGYWKDTAVKITGESVRSFTYMFLNLWNAFRKEKEDIRDYLSAPIQKGKAAPTEKATCIQPYDDSPLDNVSTGESVYVDILNRAVKYVYIFTPYLVLDDSMRTALCRAALRGVDVRIVTPGIPDKKLTYRLTRANYSLLLKSGVRIFEYTPGFIHAKSMVCDDECAVVGSINLDYRSLYHHFENAVYFSGCEAVASVRKDCEETFAISRERTEENFRRGIVGRLVDSVLRVFETLL